MPSTEMMKKLLEEFAQNEVHTREEINTINEQIAELERRILASQRKLELVSQDRDKVHIMMGRYSKGADYPSAAAPVSGNGAKKRSTFETAAPAAPAQSEPARISQPSPRASATRLKAMPDPTLAQPEAVRSNPFLPPVSPATQPESPPPAPAVPPQPQHQVEQQPFSFGFPNAEHPTEVAAQAASGTHWQPVPAAAPLPAAAPAPAHSPSAALSSSSFFSDDDDLDVPSAPAVHETNPTNPFLKSAIAGRSTGEHTAPAPAPQIHSDPFADNLNAAPAPHQEDNSATSGAQISDLESDEEGDDTVKSINDALRGLFR